MDEKSWYQLMNAFGFPKNEQEYKMIMKAYTQNHRKYHNATHIDDCLDKCTLNEFTQFNHELHMAIWYHDIIYQPYKKNNEFKSAICAEKFLLKQGVSMQMISKIKKLIMVTLHNQDPESQDEAYMMDIDISILGSSNDAYLAYTAHIRKEYKLVPSFIYKKKRRAILEMFLKREKLYYTKYFNSRLEEKARANIKNELQLLTR